MESGASGSGEQRENPRPLQDSQLSYLSGLDHTCRQAGCLARPDVHFACRALQSPGSGICGPAGRNRSDKLFPVFSFCAFAAAPGDCSGSHTPVFSSLCFISHLLAKQESAQAELFGTAWKNMIYCKEQSSHVSGVYDFGNPEDGAEACQKRQRCLLERSILFALF